MSLKFLSAMFAVALSAASPAFAQISVGSGTSVGASLPSVGVNSSTNAGVNTSSGSTNSGNANASTATQSSGTTDASMAPGKPEKPDSMGNGGLGVSSSTNANLKN